jgi:hypothetical protein
MGRHVEMAGGYIRGRVIAIEHAAGWFRISSGIRECKI